jgi:hypothetical protein
MEIKMKLRDDIEVVNAGNIIQGLAEGYILPSSILSEPEDIKKVTDAIKTIDELFVLLYEREELR